KTISTPLPEPCPMMLATLFATITVKHLVGQPVAAMARYVAQGIAWTSELTTCCLSTIQKKKYLAAQKSVLGSLTVTPRQSLSRLTIRGGINRSNVPVYRL